MLGMKQKKGYGVQILDNQIRIVAIQAASKRLTLKICHSQPLPAGAILNGKIVDEDVVSQSIEAAVNRLDIHGEGIHLSIPTSSALLRKSFFPVMNDKELRNMIEVELISGSQMPFKDPVFDFVRLGSDPDNEKAEKGTKKGKQDEVLIFASPSHIVDSYVRVVRQAGLKPLSVELPPLASFRLLLLYLDRIKEPLPECFIVINAEANQLEFSIFVDGVPVFLHSVQDLSYGDSYVQKVATELSRIIYYYKYSISSKQDGINEIYLLGDQEQLWSLSQMVKEVYDGRILTLPLETWIKDPNDYIQSYAVPIGLAMKGA